MIETWAGTGERKPTPDGAPIAGTPLNGPRAITSDPDGNLYLVLREGNAVYRIDARDGRIHHLAGSVEPVRLELQRSLQRGDLPARVGKIAIEVRLLALHLRSQEGSRPRRDKARGDGDLTPRPRVIPAVRKSLGVVEMCTRVGAGKPDRGPSRGDSIGDVARPVEDPAEGGSGCSTPVIE